MQFSLVKHLDRRGATIVEIMAMIAVLGLAMTAIFSTVMSGISFEKDSENRIKAINLAREGIEGITSLRNTNWLRFSSDQTNCWKILNYSNLCIGNAAYASSNSISVGNYKLLNNYGAWYLTGTTTGTGIWIDTNGNYTASGLNTSPSCNSTITTDCKTLFTREIRITNTTATSLSIQSVVEWNEKGKRDVILETTLTNWKNKFH